MTVTLQVNKFTLPIYVILTTFLFCPTLQNGDLVAQVMCSFKKDSPFVAHLKYILICVCG